MTVRSAMNGPLVDGSGEKAFEAGKSRVPDRQRKPESGRGPLGLAGERLVGNLGEVHDLAVIAEIGLEELRKAVDPEALDDQRVEMPGEIVGEEEGRGLLLGQGIEFVEPHEEG